MEACKVVLSCSRHMYWTDVKHGNIGKAGMDGSNPTVLVQDGLVWPNALALDPPADRLYWLDAHSDEAHSVRLDGSDRKVMAANYYFLLMVRNCFCVRSSKFATNSRSTQTGLVCNQFSDCVVSLDLVNESSVTQ